MQAKYGSLVTCVALGTSPDWYHLINRLQLRYPQVSGSAGFPLCDFRDSLKEDDGDRADQNLTFVELAA